MNSPKWIAPARVENNRNVYFRAIRKFTLDSVEPSQKIKIAAESYYLLRINGVFIGRGPARGVHSRNYYDTWDVGFVLRNGNNKIEILCQCMNYDTFVASPAQPALWVDLEDVLVSDSQWQVQIASEWRQRVHPYSVQVGDMEWRDDRNANLFAWTNAVELSTDAEVCKKALVPRDVPKLTEKVFRPVDIPLVATVPPQENVDSIYLQERFSYEKHTKIETDVSALLIADSDFVVNPQANGGGVAIVFDFAKEIVGHFELEINAESGTTIDVGYDEALLDGRMLTDHSQVTYCFTDRYIVKDGWSKIGNILHQRGFSMVQIVIREFTKPVIIRAVKAIDTRYPYAMRGSFFSSDMLLNRIWEISRETLDACTTDVFTDCPWRERSFWFNDMVVENRTMYQMFGDSRLHKRCFRMIVSDVLPNDLLPGVCPCPRDAEKFVLLAPNFYGTETLRDYYLYTGDVELVKEILPYFIRSVKRFADWEDENGIIQPPEKYWNFIDWSYELNNLSMTGKPSSLLCLFYLQAIKNLIYFAEMLNFELDSWFYKRAKELPKQIYDAFFDREKGILLDTYDAGNGQPSYSQLAQGLALLTEACQDNLRSKAIDALGDDTLLCPEFYFHFMLFHAMNRANKQDVALARIRKHWGRLAKLGASTWWESGIHGTTGKASDHGDGSLCHGFATAPVDFLQTEILGVTPTKPGFATFKFDPHICDLQFAEGRVPTPKGNIYVKWEKNTENSIQVKLTVPYGTIATTKVGNFIAGNHTFELTC